MPAIDPIGRAHEKRGFYLHAIVFIIVNSILTVVNLRKDRDEFWVKWVLLDWGVGLATHAWIVFRATPGDDTEQPT